MGAPKIPGSRVIVQRSVPEVRPARVTRLPALNQNISGTIIPDAPNGETAIGLVEGRSAARNVVPPDLRNFPPTRATHCPRMGDNHQGKSALMRPVIAHGKKIALVNIVPNPFGRHRVDLVPRVDDEPPDPKAIERQVGPIEKPRQLHMIAIAAFPIAQIRRGEMKMKCSLTHWRASSRSAPRRGATSSYSSARRA